MKALVLSSGGLDSTTCLGIAVEKYGKENVVTASLFYGQKHFKELECANKVARYYGVPHYELNISSIFEFSNCSLLEHSTEKIVHESYAQQIQEIGSERINTYVPFRNGLLLSIAAAYADGLFPKEQIAIFFGGHADDAVGNVYADCTPEFVAAMNAAINIGTYKKIFIESPLVNMHKAQVVKRGLELHVPYELTWSCYEGGEKQCGECGTCIDRRKAFEANGVEDPVGYEK